MLVAMLRIVLFARVWSVCSLLVTHRRLRWLRAYRWQPLLRCL